MKGEKGVQGSYCDVSVVIPTYNRLKFLQAAVDSVLKQTIPPKELIVVDDGSSDKTWEWLQSLSCPFLKYYRQAQQGPGIARNFGVAQASGRWIAFLDSDDQWLPKKLAQQVEFFENHLEYKVCQTEEIWIREGVRVNAAKKHQKRSGFIFEHCLSLCIISPSAVMMEREFFEKLGGFDPDFPVCEDYELWLRMTLESPVKTLPQALTIKYGGHVDQLSKKHWGMDRFRVQAMEKILTTQHLTQAQKQALLDELQSKLNILAKGFSKRYPAQKNPYRDRWEELFRMKSA